MITKCNIKILQNSIKKIVNMIQCNQKKKKVKKMYIETFAQKLKKARENAGFTQREAAKELNMKQPTIASYETGRTQPDIESLGKMIDFYQVNANWLLGTNDNSKK